MEDPIVDSEILHGGEGGDVEQRPNLETNLFVCDCLIISIYLFIVHSF